MAQAGKTCTITDLRIYPIKSCRGISLKSTTLTRQGLKYDRKWMFVDAKDKFITIRQNSAMTLINTALNEETNHLEITFPAVPHTGLKSKTIAVPLDPDESYLNQNCQKIDVEIWGSATDAWSYDSKSSSQTSKKITSAVDSYFKAINPDSQVRLVMKGPTARPAGGNGSPEHLGRKESINFPDVLPILVATEPSLRELNERLHRKNETTITIERFRPNIIVDSPHLQPWEEDEWRTLRINPPTTTTASLLNAITPTAFKTSITSTTNMSIDMDVSARCARCQVPNVDPETGDKNPKQPWDTLVSYRRVDAGIKYKPCFGMLCCPRSEGVVNVGMDISVLEVMQVAGGKGEHRYVTGF